MFSYEAEEIQGHPLSELVAESYRAHLRRRHERLGGNGADESSNPAMELFGLRKDGTEFPLEMAMSTWTTGSGTFFSGVIRDVSERKTAEVTLRDSQQRLLETSRLAGMAEVATGVLHNVGNVLNSVNVSAGLVVEKLRRSKVPNLGKAAALLTETKRRSRRRSSPNDPNGQKLPGYLAQAQPASGGGEHRNPDRSRSARAQHRTHQGNRGHAAELRQGQRRLRRPGRRPTGRRLDRNEHRRFRAPWHRPRTALFACRRRCASIVTRSCKF